MKYLSARKSKTKVLFGWQASLFCALLFAFFFLMGLSGSALSASADHFVTTLEGTKVPAATPYAGTSKALEFAIASNYATSSVTEFTFDSAGVGDESDGDGDGVYCSGDVYSDRPIISCYKV